MVFDLIGYKKRTYTVFVLLLYLWSVWAVMSFAGCSWFDEDIPPAGILASGRVTLSWDEVPGAISYNIYLSTSPGVTKLRGYKIRDAINPITITDLEPGTTYYFIVTMVNELGESEKSKKISYAVTDTEGFIDFGDLFIQSIPADKSLESVKGQTASAPEKELVGKTPEPKTHLVRTDKSDYEIIICFGDSLTFGYGAGSGMDYPSQLARMIHKPVINAGISGDTTAWALRRLQRDVLSKTPDIVLITLGGNDFKNGLSKDITFRNLKKIVESIQKRGAKVIIGGLKFGNKDRGFGRGYEKIAEQTGAMLIPNIFEGIMGNRKLMSDPIHPNNAGYTIIAQRFFKAMSP
jgi:lysophospholipase L1-like esterase